MTGWEMVTFIKNKTVFPSLPFFYLKTWVHTHAHTHTHTHTHTTFAKDILFFPLFRK